MPRSADGKPYAGSQVCVELNMLVRSLRVVPHALACGPAYEQAETHAHGVDLVLVLVLVGVGWVRRGHFMISSALSTSVGLVIGRTGLVGSVMGRGADRWTVVRVGEVAPTMGTSASVSVCLSCRAT